jgi:hypothetical protein
MAAGRIGGIPNQDLLDAPTFSDVQAEAKKIETELVSAKLQRATGPLLPPRDFARVVLKIVSPADG